MQKLAKVVEEEIRRHLRYLKEALVVLSSCSNNLHTEEKQHLTLKLLQLAVKNMNEDMTPRKPAFPCITENGAPYDLLVDRSVLLFQRLKFTTDDM